MDQHAAFGFEHAPVGLVLTRHRLIEACNATFAALFGYAPADLVGRSIAMLYPSNREFIDIGNRGRDAMRATPFYRDDRIMKGRDGRLFWCQVHGRALVRDDVFAHCVWSFADLSHQRPVLDLTRREREIATLMVEGLTNKEIAARLAVSHRTVEAHRARMIHKTGARSTAGLISILVGLPG